MTTRPLPPGASSGPDPGEREALLLGMLRVSIVAGLALTAVPVAAQLPAALASERAEYDLWLRSATSSPYRAIAQQPVGPGLRIGAGAGLPLAGVPQQWLRQDDRGVTLEIGTERRAGRKCKRLNSCQLV